MNIRTVGIKTAALALGVILSTPHVMAAGDKGMTWGFRHMSFDNTPYEGYMSGISTYSPVINTNVSNLPVRSHTNNSGLQKQSIHVGCGSYSDSNLNAPPSNPTYNRCNAYQGDTSCSVKIPILCVKTGGNYKNRPPYVVTSGASALPKEAYSGWVGYRTKLTKPILGTQLTSPQAADQFCGNGWVMAEHHMGKWISGMDDNNHANGSWNTSSAKSGGWGFHTRFKGWNNQNKKSMLRNSRFWVKINNQPANCWD